ncbi:MAG: FUSC family protein, partial [Streptosporangiaceae bacterium]
QRPALGPDAGRLVDQARMEIAAALARVAAAVERHRGPAGPERSCDRIGRLAARLGDAAPERFCADRLTALAGQLRAAARMADTLTGIRRASLPVTAGHTADAVVRMPGELVTLARRVIAAAAPASPASPAFRHAVRLALVLPLTAGIAALLPLPHGYWLSLTAVIVLKPDFGTTVGLGVARILGTLAGAVATGLILALAHPHGAVLAGLVAVCAWAGFTLYQANYALYAIFLTSLVLLLISPAEQHELGTTLTRGLLTVLGGGIAIGAYLAWPTWQAVPLRSAAADRFEALAAFLDAVLRGYVDPAGCDGAALARLATAARRAQFRVQASLDRAAAEPAGVRPDLDDYGGVLAAGRRIAAGAHALARNLRDSGQQVTVPEAAAIASEVGTAMTAIVRALATSSAPGPLPALRRSQQDLAAAAAAGQTPRHHRAAILAALLDPLVDAIDTTAGQLADLAAAGTRSGRPTARR